MLSGEWTTGCLLNPDMKDETILIAFDPREEMFLKLLPTGVEFRQPAHE
jgi:hypothetical protein